MPITGYTEHLLTVGKFEAAVAQMKIARDLDPLSMVVNFTLGRVYSDARRYREAFHQCGVAIELDPNRSMGHWCLGQVYIGEGRYREAIVELERGIALGTTPLLVRDLSYAYAALGNPAKSRSVLGTLKNNSGSGYLSPYSLAVLYGALGEKDRAFQWLEKAYAERDAQVTGVLFHVEMDALRSDPRFASLLRRMNLPQ